MSELQKAVSRKEHGEQAANLSFHKKYRTKAQHVAARNHKAGKKIRAALRKTSTAIEDTKTALLKSGVINPYSDREQRELEKLYNVARRSTIEANKSSKTARREVEEAIRETVNLTAEDFFTIEISKRSTHKSDRKRSSTSSRSLTVITSSEPTRVPQIAPAQVQQYRTIAPGPVPQPPQQPLQYTLPPPPENFPVVFPGLHEGQVAFIPPQQAGNFYHNGYDSYRGYY